MDEPIAEELNINRTLIGRALAGLVGILAIAGACGVLFRGPIERVALAFMERFGLLGVAVGVVITDASPVPLTSEPILILATGAGVDPWLLFAVSAAASTIAGPVGYLGGRLVGQQGLRAWLQRRAPRLALFMHRYGVMGVAIAALLPIPFALSTWTAGMSRIRFPGVLAASLLRIPKTGLYLLLIVQGWALGG